MGELQVIRARYEDTFIDIARAYDLGFDELVHVWGADHGGYVKRLKAIAGAFSDNTVEADVLLCQLVRLLKNGEPVKMSKRAGNFVTVREDRKSVV